MFFKLLLNAFAIGENNKYRCLNSKIGIEDEMFGVCCVRNGCNSLLDASAGRRMTSAKHHKSNYRIF